MLKIFLVSIFLRALASIGENNPSLEHVMPILNAEHHSSIDENSAGNIDFMPPTKKRSSPRTLKWDFKLPVESGVEKKTVKNSKRSKHRRLPDEKESKHFPYIGVSYKVDNPPYSETFIVPYLEKDDPEKQGAKKKDHVIIKGKKKGGPPNRSRKLPCHSANNRKII